MAGMTREQFVEQILKIVPEKFPLVKLARGDEPFSLRVNSNIVSLENLYRLAVLQPEEMRRNVERWMVELLRAAEGSPDRNGSYESLKERILPMILPEDAGAAHADTVSEPLIEGLRIAYAIDSDRTIAYIPRAQFEEWKMSTDDLHAQALDNLVARSETMEASAAQDDDGKISLILFQTGDGYDASRLLLPTLHERLREHLGSPFAAAIPTRDMLLCFRSDAQTVGRVKKQVADDYRSLPHQVTDRLLLITADGIAVM
ncbi:MAG TPA: DUF1444 family protein [Tepidisphaeraceae bacterium]|nr:DUF1444 family protein [Tepidisphaeraceae bacterium]